MAFVLILFFLALLMTFLIKKTTILNPKIGEPILNSLKENIFVFKNKSILVITLDMIAVLFGASSATYMRYIKCRIRIWNNEAAPAVGALIIMFMSAYIPVTKNAGKKLLVAIFSFGISIIVSEFHNILFISIYLLIYGITMEFQ